MKKKFSSVKVIPVNKCKSSKSIISSEKKEEEKRCSPSFGNGTKCFKIQSMNSNIELTNVNELVNDSLTDDESDLEIESVSESDCDVGSSSD
jgi:hypothetical protein